MICTFHNIKHRRCDCGNRDTWQRISGSGREGYVWGLEDFLEDKTESGWTAE
jgi:hypothetical protein